MKGKYMSKFPTQSGKGVRIRVSADTAKARRDIKQLDGSFKKIDKTASNSTRNLVRLAGSITAAFTGVAAVRSINRTTDALVGFENQVALVVGRTDVLAKQMDTIYKISLKTRTPVASTAEIFNRMGRALKSSGASVKEINDAVIILNKAAAISGGSVESQKAAFIQLGQGLAAGALRGQELNSVMEQLPRVSAAIADELGVGIDQLRKMAEEGQLTADVVFAAMLNQAESINKEFENIENTSGKAFVQLKDQIGRLTAELSLALGVTSAFTGTYENMAYWINDNRVGIVAGAVRAKDAFRTFRLEVAKGLALDGGLSLAARTFESISRLASSHLQPVEDFIKGWAERISGYFFKIYDEVIGHSWWTDTMKETEQLADKYLPKVEKKVRGFAARIVESFKNLYNNSKGAFDLNVKAAITGYENLRENVAKAISEGVRKGISSTVGLSGEIRKAVVTGMLAAFTIVFSTGSITKSLSKIANKIGPLFGLAVLANLVEAVGSPKVFASLGLMAGEFLGAMARQIGAAIPEIVLGALAAIPSAILGFWKEAGFILGPILAVGIAASMSKTIRSTLAGMGNLVTGGFLGKTATNKGGATIIAPAFGKALKTATPYQLKLHQIGVTLRSKVQPAVNSLNATLVKHNIGIKSSAAYVGNLAMQNQRLAVSVKTVDSAVKTNTGSWKSFGKIAGLATFAMLAAGSAFASTGELANQSALSIENAMLGGFAALTLFPAEIADAAKAIGRKFGSIAGVSMASGMIKAFAIKVGAIAAGAAAAIAGSIVLPIVIAVGSIAAAGGLAYVMLFGEGNTFSKKVKSVVDDVKAQFNLLNVSTFAAGKEFFDSVDGLRNSGDLAKTTFGNRRLGEQLSDINFVSLPDVEAREIVKAVNELKEVQVRAAAEQSRYNNVTEETQKAVLEAQKRLQNAANAAEGVQSSFGRDFGDALISAMEENSFESQGAVGVTSEALIRSFLPFLKNESATNRDNVRSIIENNNLQSQEDIRALLTNLGQTINLGENFGPDVAKALKQLNETTLDRENLDGFAALVDAIQTREEREIVRAIKELEDSLADSGRRLEQRTLQSSLETIKGNRDLKPSELAQISRSEAFGLSNLINTLKGAEGRLQFANDNRGSFSDEEREGRANLVSDLRKRLEKMYSDALGTSFERLNLDTFQERLTAAGMSAAEAISFGISFPSGSFASGNQGELSRMIDRAENYSTLIEDLKGKLSDLTSEEKIQLSVASRSQKLLNQNIDAMATFVDLQDSTGLAERIEMLSAAADLSKFNIDMDKLLAVDPATGDKITELTGRILSLKLAIAFNATGNSSMLDSLGMGSAAEGIAEISKLMDQLNTSTAGFAKSEGSTTTPIERIIQGTGLALSDLATMSNGALIGINTALKSIEASEKAINKASLNNVGLREKQLSNIREQSDLIRNTLLSGSVGSAQVGLSALGFDSDVVNLGERGINAALRIEELTRQKLALNVEDREGLIRINRLLQDQQDILEEQTSGDKVYESFTQGIKGSIAEALKSGDFKGAFYSFADSFTSTVIDVFVGSLVDSLINEDALKNVFKNIFNGGEGGEGGGIFSEISKMFGEDGTFGKMFKGITDSIGKLFSGDGFGSIFSNIFSIFGFDQGGVVPSTKYSQVGKDSVPAMLKPGERVIDPRKGNYSAPSGSQTVVNLNITGDISRQTRKEVMGMIPQIAGGVNATNKERGYRA
jgi:tape measure domain-containing protein